MKVVYMDESGISVNEPIAVVAGVVFDPDSQWRKVRDYLDGLVSEFVPEEHRAGFTFHATDLFHGRGKVFDRRRYSLERSHEALKRVLTIPAMFQLSIVFGYMKKGILSPLPSGSSQKLLRREASTNAKAYHSGAYSLAAVAVESFMRQHAAPNQIAMLSVENNRETGQAVKDAHRILKGDNLKSKRDMGIFTLLSEVAPSCLPIRRIVDGVNLVEKHESPLLQIADACALVIRYSLEEKATAKAFIEAFSQGHPERIPVKGATEENMAGYNILVFSARS